MNNLSALIPASVNVNYADSCGFTFLMMAANYGNLVVVLFLLNNRADPNRMGPYETTALYWAALNGHVQVVTALLDAGANVNQARATDGTTPLYVASQKGHWDVVTALLGAGADPNMMGPNGTAPLYWAARNGHIRVVTAMLDA